MREMSLKKELFYFQEKLTYVKDPVLATFKYKIISHSPFLHREDFQIKKWYQARSNPKAKESLLIA